jgi:hypothetical protein
MQDSLKSDVEKDFDYSCLERFIDKPGRVTLDPTATVFMEECRRPKLNWLMLWCLGFVLTSEYVVSDATVNKNYFLVPSKKFRTWHEGVAAGIQYLEDKKIDYTLSSLDNVYGRDTGKRVSEVFVNVMLFCKSEGSAKPPPVTAPLPRSPEPLPVPSEPLPVPSRPIPEPAAPAAPSNWKAVVAGILGAIAIPWFFAKLFLPGGVVTFVNLLLDFLHKLVGM